MLFSFCFTFNLLIIKKKQKKCAEDSVAVLGHHSTDFWKFAFSLWLGWTSTESHRKEMHRTRNVRGSGVSVVPRTDLKTEGKQPNNRETGYREYRFKRNSRRNEENECLIARCDLNQT